MFDLPRSSADEAPNHPAGDLARESAGAEAQAKPLGLEDSEHRHRRLMGLLKYEGDQQGEERRQMGIDEQFYHHCQWTREDAQTLMERGQAPIVRNESRQTVDWLVGTEARMRKDYRVLPREENDRGMAEIKEKLCKYTDDANLTQWQRSAAFKEYVTSGLAWLEEGVNPDPEREIIYSGWASWRDILRDSNSSALDYNDDARYVFRKRRVDLDYAVALLPNQRTHLIEAAESMDNDRDGDDPWYLGESLHGAGESADMLPASMSRRSSFISHSEWWQSPRSQVNLIECWYRTPERVKVFSGGTAQGTMVMPANPEHMQAVKAGAATYEAVKMRMRVMIATKHAPCLDVATPYSHQRFPLIPLIAYRRPHDGMVYGVMRGMRDAQESLNKRHSKALFALSANRIIMEHGAADDIEDLRLEAARPNGIIVRKRGHELTFDKNEFDFQGSLQLAAADVESIRNAGGVTNENLGRDTNAASGKAIIAKQDQGSLATMELFDRYLLAIRNAGTLRLANIEQFYTEPKAVRILGENRPIEWVTINKLDPATGQILDDVTAGKADYIVDTQDYRASAAQAAMEQMFALLGQIATFAPQVVLSVLDLVVESAEIKNKEEWVTRIRKLNGQRDPTKPPTPEEQQAEQVAAGKQAEAEQLQIETVKATLGKLQADAQLSVARSAEIDASGTLKRVETMFQAIQSALSLATAPELAAAADEIATSAGLQDMNPGPVPLPAAQPMAMAEQPEMQPQPGQPEQFEQPFPPQ